MRRVFESPIKDTREVWPLAAAHVLRWGSDSSGELWVAVEDKDGQCEAFMPYKDYLDVAADPQAGFTVDACVARVRG